MEEPPKKRSKTMEEKEEVNNDSSQDMFADEEIIEEEEVDGQIDDTESQELEEAAKNPDEDIQEVESSQEIQSQTPRLESPELMPRPSSPEQISKGPSWKGVSLAALNSNLCIDSPAKSDPNATIFVKWPRNSDDERRLEPFPDPKSARDIWDEHHVRMPFSEESYFPIEEKGKNRKVLKKR
jgi:hypothetical protein